MYIFHKLATDILQNCDSYARILWVAVSMLLVLLAGYLLVKFIRGAFTLTQDNENSNVSS